MKNVFPIIVFVAFFSLSCKQTETLTREEVMTVIRNFDNAWKNKNAGGVDSVLSPSYIYFTQSGGAFGKNNILQTAGSDDYKLDSMERQQLDIKIEGNTAIVNTIWNGKGSYFGNEFNDKQRCSVTIIKRKGKVEILSEHCTLIR